MKKFVANLNFSKNKLKIFTFIFLVGVFIWGVIFIDFKNGSQKEMVSVIGVAEEKILKNAQFYLDYTIYGISEDDVKKKLDDKITEIKSLIKNSDQILASEMDKSLTTDCIINPKFYAQVKGLEEGKCLSNNWRGQARIKLIVKGDSYSDEIRKNVLSLAPKIVNSANGPIFLKKKLDKDYENILIEKAIQNARLKAEKMAEESGRKIKKTISIDENPLVKNNLMSIQTDERELLSPGEDILEKKIEVKFELD